MANPIPRSVAGSQQVHSADEADYRFERIFTIQTDQPIPPGEGGRFEKGRALDYRVFSVTRCGWCRALVLEEDVDSHSQYHAENVSSRFWGLQPGQPTE